MLLMSKLKDEIGEMSKSELIIKDRAKNFQSIASKICNGWIDLNEISGFE
jgi:hypothetical protein